MSVQTYCWCNGKYDKAKANNAALKEENERLMKIIIDAEKQAPAAYGIPNSRPTESQPMISLHHQRFGQYPELMVPLYALQVDAEYIKEINRMLERRYAKKCELLLSYIAHNNAKEGEIIALKARVAELEAQRLQLSEAAYNSIMAFNNWQDETLAAPDRIEACLKHVDCVRNLWNVVATQYNERAKDPSNEA